MIDGGSRGGSPSSWRAWIEIHNPLLDPAGWQSPSSWRAWIEILSKVQLTSEIEVALLVEGVDRNTKASRVIENWRPSPSSWRAWIEISAYTAA